LRVKTFSGVSRTGPQASLRQAGGASRIAASRPYLPFGAMCAALWRYYSALLIEHHLVIAHHLFCLVSPPPAFTGVGRDFRSIFRAGLSSATTHDLYRGLRFH
jgi:hypothetical protein